MRTYSATSRECPSKSKGKGKKGGVDYGKGGIDYGKGSKGQFQKGEFVKNSVKGGKGKGPTGKGYQGFALTVTAMATGPPNVACGKPTPWSKKASRGRLKKSWAVSVVGTSSTFGRSA